MKRMVPLPLRRRARVSVVVPCYNYGRYLPEAVDSALTQSGVDVDVHVIDDASTDGSDVVARTLAVQHPQVRATVHNANSGHIATYNEGLRQADGDYVILLSADDLLTPGQLARAAALMDQIPEVGLVYGNPLDFTTERPTVRCSVSSWSVWTGRSWLRRISQRGQGMIVTPEAVVRTSLVHKLNGFDERLPQAADLHLWMRAATRMDVARVNGCDQGLYRVHGSNMHVTTYAGLLRDLQARRETFEIFFREDGQRLPNWEARYDAVRRALAAEARRLAREELDGGGVDTDAFHQFLTISNDLSNRQRRLTRLDVQRVARASAGLGPSPVQRVISIRRDFEARLRWQRWLRFGT